MTDGPYRFTRNPMLVGIYIYDLGVLLWLQSWWPLAIFAAEVILRQRIVQHLARVHAGVPHADDFAQILRAHRPDLHSARLPYSFCLR